MVLRVTVARSARSERKLWTGKPSWVRLVAALRSAASERSALATIEARLASAAALSWSSNRMDLSARRMLARTACWLLGTGPRRGGQPHECREIVRQPACGAVERALLHLPRYTLEET